MSIQSTRLDPIRTKHATNNNEVIMTKFISAIKAEFNDQYADKQFKSDTGPIGFTEFITQYFGDVDYDEVDDIEAELDTWVRDVLDDNVI